MSNVTNEKPETGAQAGVYELENLEGEKVQLVAQNFPQADAFVRMGATFIKSFTEWNLENREKVAKAAKEAEAAKEAKAAKATDSEVKKGK